MLDSSRRSLQRSSTSQNNSVICLDSFHGESAPLKTVRNSFDSNSRHESGSLNQNSVSAGTKLSLDQNDLPRRRIECGPHSLVIALCYEIAMMQDTDDDDDDAYPDDTSNDQEGFDLSGDSLDKAIEYVNRGMRSGGVRCPCCEQICKIYKRPLNATMARSLIIVYQHTISNPDGDWIHVPTLLVNMKRDSTVAGGDAAKLRFWGCLEPKRGEREDGSTRIGYYRITDIGRKFVEKKITLPRYIYLYNQELKGVSEETVTIDETLGVRFNYNELMNDS